MDARRLLLIASSCFAGETVRIVPSFMKVRERDPTAQMTLLANEEGLIVVTHAAVVERVVVSKVYACRRAGGCGSAPQMPAVPISAELPPVQGMPAYLVLQLQLRLEVMRTSPR